MVAESPEQRRARIKEDIQTRVRYLYIAFVVLGLVMAIRIIYIQIGSNEVSINASKFHGRIFHSQNILAHRGAILSRDGETLATSILRYHVEMDFGSEGFDSLELFHRHSDSLSKLLASYFGDRSVAEYRDLFRSNRASHYKLQYRKDTLVERSSGWFDRIIDAMRGDLVVSKRLYDTIRDHRPVNIFPRDVDYAEWQVLRRYPILNWNMGMTYSLESSSERIYTQRGMAQRTIGAINADRGDDYGIEAVYNDYLRGEDGLVVRQRIARGFYGRVVGEENREAVDGCDVVTTIDVELQDVAAAALRRAVEDQRALWGTTVVMEVATGDILAIANLDRHSDGRYSEQRNRAIGARSEPGSTFKLASTMALLEVAKMPTSTIIDSENGDRVKIGNAWVQDSHREGNEVDLRTAFSKSLNVYFAKAIYENFKDEPTQYTDFLKSLHLDRAMGLEAFGEQSPRLPTQGSKLWTPHMTLVNMGYGYGVELAPIQTLTLYNAVANGGRMVAPRLVKEIRHDGRVVERMPVKVLVDQVCSKPTLDTLRSFMGDVCREGGTAYWFLGRFKGFNVAAKTGTAQFAQDGYHYRDGVYIGTMAGFMPAESPKYSVITVLQVQRGVSRTIYGAGMSGPVVEDIMQYLYNREHQWHTQLDTVAMQSTPSKIKYGDIESMRHVASAHTPNSTAAGSRRGWGRMNVSDSTSQMVVTDLPLEEGVMPNLYGMALRDAIFLLESRGIEVKVTGRGAVWRQSVKAGATIKEGQSVTLQLK